MIMKKILFAFFALIGILTSCTNDDITISNSITFKINPLTVVDNLYEYKAGDLTSLGSSYKLNVSLFIYNSEGILANKVTNQYSAYTHMMTANIDLPAGNYTAVAETHVSGSIEFWDIEGTEHLSTFKITDNGYIGGKSKILGLSIRKFNIEDDTKTIDIDVENAGAVACVQFSNWKKYNNVKTYALMGKQSCDYITFDTNGNNDYSLESSSSYGYYMYKSDYDSNYSGSVGYFFTFPIKNASFRFYAETTNKERVPIGTEFVDDVKKGKSYLFLYVCNDEGDDEAYWYDMINSESKSRALEIQEKVISEDKYINGHLVYDYEDKSISIK